MDITLKKLQQEDIEMVRIWRNSPEVSPYMYTSDFITEEQQQNWWNKTKDDTTSIYWIIEYDGKPIGLASLTGISKVFNSCYWAFYLGSDVPRGGGVGSKIEYNVLEYVFDELKLEKLRCEVITFNDKVISMHEKFGFRREAFYRHHVKKDGKWQDVVGLAILKDEWEVQKEVMKNKIYKVQL
jgi:UDP-4-amino-4,6-dideoxy-N-acetyl-beta-L-altrosamine N-acetyltransferase